MSSIDRKTADRLTRYMIDAAARAPEANQVHILHSHIEQLHGICAHMPDFVLSQVSIDIADAMSVGSETGFVCEHCQKAARLLTEYLEAMRVNNQHHAEVIATREALEND